MIPGPMTYENLWRNQYNYFILSLKIVKLERLQDFMQCRLYKIVRSSWALVTN